MSIQDEHRARQRERKIKKLEQRVEELEYNSRDKFGHSGMSTGGDGCAIWFLAPLIPILIWLV